MAYEWRQDFEEGQTRATCSKCGIPYRYPAEIVKLEDGFFYCRRTCLEKTVLARDRIIAASRRRREMPPPKFVIPPRYAEDYEKAEGWIFSLATAATTTLTVTSARVANYFADLLIENKRPTSWLTAARTGLDLHLKYLITQQFGAPGGRPSLVTGLPPVPGQAIYGAVTQATLVMTSLGLAYAGMAFVKGYQITGTTDYLLAADRCAECVRGLQCNDLRTVQTALRPSFPFGGPTIHLGGIPQLMNVDAVSEGANSIGYYYLKEQGATIRFLLALQAVRGTTYTYGMASPSQFSASTVATIATMISEVQGFLLNGGPDIITGTTYSGLSASTPREVYYPFQFGQLIGTFAGRWYMSQVPNVGTSITGANWAHAIRGLYELSGYSAASGVYSYLMGMTSNAANRLTADPVILLAGLQGTYDPTYALASSMEATDGIVGAPGPNGTAVTGATLVTPTETTGTGYDWETAGLLAPIQSAKNTAAFTRAKDTMSTPQLQDTLGGAVGYLGTLIQSGLSFQPRDSTRSRNVSTQPAVLAADIYRYQPRAFRDQYTNPKAAS